MSGGPAAPAYRPDIDGLRALAVLAVVLFHAEFAGFSGGYVGVDVFFVISGYLITGLIRPRLIAGDFSLLDFYARRVRRIFPALLVLLVITFAAASLVLLPEALERLGESTAAATLFLSNVYFLTQAGYFAAGAETQPLLHTWSLAVEEQFYLLFPLLLMLLQRRWPARAGRVIAALALLSFGAALLTLTESGSAAFYLPHARAWELLLGAFLACGTLPDWPRRWLREAAAAVGLALVVSAPLLLDPQSGVPGFAALWPCAGAALLLHAGAGGTTATGRLLSLRPLVGLGLISYSLYLWHWPLLVLLRESQVEPPEGLQVAVALLLALVLAALSWRFVEQPARRHATAPRRTVLLGLAASALVLALALAGALGGGWPWRFGPETLRYAALLDKATHFPDYDRGGCFLDYDQAAGDYDRMRCLPAAEVPRERRLLIWGDSFAAHLYPGLSDALEAQGWSVAQYTATSCRPLASGRDRRCDAVHAQAAEILGWNGGFAVVVVAAYYPPYAERLGEATLRARLAEGLALARQSGARVLLVGQTPIFPFAIPRLLIDDATLRDPAELRWPAERFDALNAGLAETAGAAGVDFLDPTAAGCDAAGCLAAMAGEPLHWDYGHLTRLGSLFYARAILGALGITSP